MYRTRKIYVISILIPLLVGGASALLGMRGMAQYKLLAKPPLAPPGIVFPIVWTVLFILMGVSSALIYRSGNPLRELALVVYAAQLAVNFFWTVFFFMMEWRLFAFFWILLLGALVFLMIRLFRRILPIAGYLQLPYFVWLVFAAYLNLGVWWLNR